MTVPSWRFGVLGPLVVERDGRAVPLPSGRQRSLLALLLLGGGAPVSRDRLIDELWGERPPASAVSALHVHLSKLRGLLGGLLALEPAGYSLRSGDYDVDLWRFDALAEQARTAGPAEARSLLAEALALFRGEPLGDVESEGSVAAWRRALEEKRLQAMISHLDAQLAAGAGGELVAELERLAAEHPFEERVWGQLMLALYRADRQADALDAYQRARRLFAAELGLEPGESLARLQQRILERDGTLLVSERRPGPERAPVRPASNLPRPPTKLVGREGDLKSLSALTTDPDVRLVTLTGPGGVGKTRLLLELARRLEPGYADGVVFVRLERLTDPALVAAEIASALAARDGTDGPSADGLMNYLADRELLIAADNFEHLLPAAPLLSELLALAPGLRVVVSSRSALRIRGEQVFEVQPLGLPAGESDLALAQSPAVQLFLERALAADRSLDQGAATTRTVAGICRALDGLPLAIELAASRSHTLTPGQIADQLVNPLSIGEHALRDLPVRQQTLQATIRWSYDLLTEDARGVMRNAGVFLGGFTLPALEAVARGAARSHLAELVEASLVRRQTDDRRRFELLELVRAFALDELEATGGAPEARTRHRHYFAAQAAAASDAFDPYKPWAELAGAMSADHANLRAALDAAIESGDRDSALELALGLRPLWLAGMLSREGQEFVNRVLERFDVPAPEEIALLRTASFIESSDSRSLFTRRLAARAAEVGDRDALVIATCNLFSLAMNARDLEEVGRLKPTLLELVATETDVRSVGWIHYHLACEAYVEGDVEGACEHAERSVEAAAATGSDFMLAGATGARLLVQSAREGSMAQPALDEVLELARRAVNEPIAVFALWLVARYAAGVAPETAGRWLAHAERIRNSLNDVLWPESIVRDETVAVLGLTDLAAVLDSTPPLDHAAALADAAAWLAGRDRGERAPRERMQHVTLGP